MARIKSILSEAKQIERAVALIHLGARLQVLESETDLSYERLLRLYKEVAGKSPSKGQLPFSTDWFMTWQPNIHSSLFVNIYQTLIKNTDIEDIDAIIKAYRMYLEQITQLGLPEVLSLTRAWRRPCAPLCHPERSEGSALRARRRRPGADPSLRSG